MDEPAISLVPRLPRSLALPLRLLPSPVHSRLLAGVLNRILAEQLRQGELDFLQGRAVTIAVRDAGFRYSITLDGNALAATPPGLAKDLSIEATVFDFLVLAGRQEDPDTLVFQRRLVMQGDTELGLSVKNFLDSIDADSLAAFGLLERLLANLVPLYRRLFA